MSNIRILKYLLIHISPCHIPVPFAGILLKTEASARKGAVQDYLYLSFMYSVGNGEDVGNYDNFTRDFETSLENAVVIFDRLATMLEFGNKPVVRCLRAKLKEQVGIHCGCSQ